MSTKFGRVLLVLVISVEFLTGCATTAPSISLSTENIKSIKKIRIDKNVSKPSEIIWDGGKQAWSAVLFGALGAIATADSAKSEGDLMIQFMEQNGIDISDLMYREAKKQAESLKLFNVTDDTEVDARLIVSIIEYGLMQTHPFGSVMDPMIRITGKLVKPNNKVIWQESVFISVLDSENDQGQSVETYHKEPEKLKIALARISEVAVKSLLGKLRPESNLPDE